MGAVSLASALATDVAASRGALPLRDRLLRPSQLNDLPVVRPLVDGLLYRDTLAQLAGQPGTYKSFLTINLACALATGRDWAGHRVPERERVVYVAAEGASGLQARILAWSQYNHVSVSALDNQLYILPEPLQLGDEVDVSEAVEVAHDLGAALLVLDTRARCTLGMEENSSTHQGEAIHAAERFPRAAGCAVLVVHHSGRSSDHGRGSNAWDGAVWSDLRLTRSADLRCTVKCEKHKEVPDGCNHHYRLVPHLVSESLMPRARDETVEEYKQRRSTLVVVQRTDADEAASTNRAAQAVLDVLRTSGAVDGLTVPEILPLAAEHGVARSSLYEATKSLVGSGASGDLGTTSREALPTHRAPSAKPRACLTSGRPASSELIRS